MCKRNEPTDPLSVAKPSEGDSRILSPVTFSSKGQPTFTGVSRVEAVVNEWLAELYEGHKQWVPIYVNKDILGWSSQSG